MPWHGRQAEDILTAVWLAEAEDGVFRLPPDISGTTGLAVHAAMTRFVDRVGDKPPARVYIDTASGDNNTWLIAALVQRMEATVHIGLAAISAGLAIAVAVPGGQRVCSAGTRFGWHGSLYKVGRDPSGMSDEARAEYMAARTARPVQWWQSRAGDGSVLEFGAREALEWGVVTEVR